MNTSDTLGYIESWELFTASLYYWLYLCICSYGSTYSKSSL